jgi:hypothetical protein
MPGGSITTAIRIDSHHGTGQIGDNGVQFGSGARGQRGGDACGEGVQIDQAAGQRPVQQAGHVLALGVGDPQVTRISRGVRRATLINHAAHGSQAS